MLRFWDFECPAHGQWEILLDQAPPDAIYCPECQSVAPRVWKHAPIMAGPEKGRYPYFDVQLGKRLESRKHHDQVLGQMGLERAGSPQARIRQAYLAPPPPEDVLGPETRQEFREAALKAYHDVETRAIPLETHPSVEATEAIQVNVPNPKE